MRRVRGMVLLTTVIMILLIASMVLSLMHAVLLFNVSVQQLEQHRNVDVALDHIMRQLVSRLASASTWPCQRASENMSVHACHWRENKHIYHYWVTDLGLFPCLTMLNHGHEQGSHHWLIEIQPKQQELMLRVRAAVPASCVPCDLPWRTRIASGVLSWSMR